MTLSETVGTAPGTDFEAARRAMIDSQLRTSGVNEHWVLAAMNRVPREDYVPADWRDAAYIDRAVPLGNGRMLAAPVVHGMMLAHARPAKDDKVLLVGESGGYLAALLAPLCGSLDVLDPSAAANGAAEADYTLLIVDGAVEVLPDALGGALAEGGRVVSGLVSRGITRLAIGVKTAGDIALQPVAEIGMPVLPEFAAPKRWSF
jgi:protein-L-isoaspartate(D-aspartate) O-methyltransferase